MKQFSIMLKPTSSLCNLRCRYCFYTDLAQQREVASYGMMSPEMRDTMLRRLQPQLESGDRVQFCFQGGEPTLVGLDWFQGFTHQTRQWEPTIAVEYALQTNATQLDGDWCRFLAEQHFLVGISLDLLPQCHDEARPDVGGQGSFARCVKALELLEQAGVEYNVLCTLTRQVAKHPQQVWRALKQHHISYVQFTPCLDALGHPGKNSYALTPQRFAQFYNQLFPLWLADWERGEFCSVKLFDDVLNLIAYGIPTACGIHGRCQPQLVVEADGSVYPCDFYCLEQYRVGSILDDALEDLLEAARFSPAQQPQPLPPLCGGCPYLSFCNGGCKRMRREIACAGEGNFCGYREFLNCWGSSLRQLAQKYAQRR